MDKTAVLNQYFGHESFRPGQEALIDALLAGRDALGIMPTGGGKSMCYQIPALMLRGITLVVSPLISLMKDQVLSLKNSGVDAAFLNTSLSPEQMRLVYRNLRLGKYKILYVAPERLGTDGFVELAKSIEISLVAVDEAHCISQWGQDFRPSYLKIPDFVAQLPKRPTVGAFTATATEQVRRDIVDFLKLNEPELVVTGFDRPNLYYEVIHPKDKMAKLLELLRERRDKSGIIYCATRKAVETVYEALCHAGYNATRYHAGLEPEERIQNQEDFIFDRKPLIVATNAFGMGIDKSNVSFIIHYNMPKCLEAYYQEAGRAGRDGQDAECILLFNASDIQTAKFLIQHAGDENEELTEEEREAVIRCDMKRLNEMIDYCKTSTCLRGKLLGYFGQPYKDYCTNCANCKAVLVETDITRPSQMILSCVKRIRDRLGYSVGKALIVRTLLGSKDKRVLELGLNKLPTYALMKDIKREKINRYVDRLEELGYLHTDEMHGGVSLTAPAVKVLFHGEKVSILEKEEPKVDTSKPKVTQEPDSDLYNELRKLRFKLSQEQKIPAYMVFSNATLADMALKKPKTLREFRRVSGVGEAKASEYGAEFIELIRNFEE